MCIRSEIIGPRSAKARLTRADSSSGKGQRWSRLYPAPVALQLPPADVTQPEARICEVSTSARKLEIGDQYEY